MDKKLRPGQTFKKEVEGTIYEIRVLSVAEEIDAADKMDESTKDSKSPTAHRRAWVEYTLPSLAGWDRPEPITDFANLVTREHLLAVMDAVSRGNSLSEDEAKN